MGTLVRCNTNGRIAHIINAAKGDALIQLMLSPKADDSMNEAYMENVCGVAEKYIGYLNKNEFTVSVHYKTLTAIGITHSERNIITIGIKATGEALAQVKEYHTERLFNLSLEYGVSNAVDNYYSALMKKIDKEKKEAGQKKRKK